jgi:telomere length regulation protein
LTPLSDLTTLLLLTVHSLPQSASTTLARNHAFITAVGTYISHPDPSVRRCGMLCAEVIAARARKALAFGGWDGSGEGKEWARDLRVLLVARDVDADSEIPSTEQEAAEDERALSIPQPDSDDEARESSPPARATASQRDSDDESLVGYASSSSSRAPSPTPSDLEEIERDPTLNVGRKRVARPVYLAQLGELLRPTTANKAEGAEEAERVKIGLSVAEELVRRRAGWGMELGTLFPNTVLKENLYMLVEENAVNLVHALVGLQDSFELPEFDNQRQAALVALVACCPHKAAP